MGCGHLALERAGIKVDKYFASEVDKYAISVTQKNFPDTIQLGDVTKVFAKDLPKIDLIIGGSPCQGFSFAGKQLAFDDPRSKLFFEYVRLVKECDPKFFLLENVRMKKEYIDVISEQLGVEPVIINSSLVSAQNRVRYYWTNIGEIEQPEDRGILLRDIVLSDVYPIELDGLRGKNGCFGEGFARVYEDKSTTLRTPSGGGNIPSFVKHSLTHSRKALEYMDREVKGGRNHWDFSHHSDIRDSKSATIIANFFKGVPYNVFKDLDVVRKFHPIECERLQTVPDNYTSGVSNTQRYKMLGNGWTIDVIAHIFKNIGKVNTMTEIKEEIPQTHRGAEVVKSKKVDRSMSKTDRIMELQKMFTLDGTTISQKAIQARLNNCSVRTLERLNKELLEKYEFRLKLVYRIDEEGNDTKCFKKVGKGIEGLVNVVNETLNKCIEPGAPFMSLL